MQAAHQSSKEVFLLQVHAAQLLQQDLQSFLTGLTLKELKATFPATKYILYETTI